tara:strand:- start:1234 stop:1575 length:342 start_codon:yes stop_codon:yes gene_type:complete
MASKYFIELGKQYIQNDSIKKLNQLLYEIKSIQDYQISIPSMYKDLFLYSSVHGTTTVLIWFIELYYELSMIEQIALRQLFFYAKYLSKKNKYIPKNWFQDYIIPLISNKLNI